MQQPAKTLTFGRHLQRSALERRGVRVLQIASLRWGGAQEICAEVAESGGLPELRAPVAHNYAELDAAIRHGFAG